MTLSRRLTLAVAGLTATMVVLVGWVSLLLADSNLNAAVDDTLRHRVSQLEAVVERAPLPPDPDALAGVDVTGAPALVTQGLAAGPALDGQILFRLVSETGEVFGNEELPLDLELLAEVAAEGEPRLTDTIVNGERYRVLTSVVDGRTFQLATSLASVDAGLADLTEALILIGIAAILASAILSAFVARRFSRPVLGIAKAVRRLSGGETTAPLPNERTDEIGVLARSFNSLLEALEVSRAQQARLVADASHELRTPLTSLRLKIEFLAQTPELSDDDREQLVAATEVELDALTALVNELVDLASNSSSDEPAESTVLADLLETVASRARLTTRRRIVVASDDTEALVRPAMVRRAVSNLIDNAHKYTPADTAIELHQFNGMIEVRDQGPGIQSRDRPYVFDRFFRSKTVQPLPGSGVGLAIVKQTAEAHAGTVWALENDLGGATVGFSVATTCQTLRMRSGRA